MRTWPNAILYYIAGSMILFSVFSALPSASRYAWAGDYLSIKGPCELAFPRDHGMHPGYRTEWWYYTGNLAASSGERFGFQLTFFRSQMSPPGAEADWPADPSAWRTKQLFLAHAAVSDLTENRFYYDEQMARGALDLAGAKQEDGLTRIHVGTWSVTLEPGEHRLRAAGDTFAFDLSCNPLKPLVAHGDRGYSLKGSKPESASCYYSFTRLETVGTVTVGGEPIPVEGTGWMDHEFGVAPLERDLIGWDWFSVQLKNNTELMIFLLRDREGSHSPLSSGTFVDTSGNSQHLSEGDFKIEIVDHWKSPSTGAIYPSRWRVQVFSRGLDLLIVPNLANQELVTEKSTQVTYWEGSVSVAGTSEGRAVEGVGYVEMTGYAEPFSPM